MQIKSAKEESKKKLEEALALQRQIEMKSESNYKTQGYLRKLKKECESLSNQIELLEAENQSIDKNTSEKDLIISIKET